MWLCDSTIFMSIGGYVAFFLMERIGTRGGSEVPGVSTMTALCCQCICLRFSDGLCDGHNSPPNPMHRGLCRLREVFDWQILSSWPEPRRFNTSSYGCHLLECQWMIIHSWLKYMTQGWMCCYIQNVKTHMRSTCAIYCTVEYAKGPQSVGPLFRC